MNDYIGLKEEIASIKCFDDWHDRAFGISCAINEIGQFFGFGNNADESIRNELELRNLLQEKARLYE